MMNPFRKQRPGCRVSGILLCAVACVTALPVSLSSAAGSDLCYRPEELRADAEAKLAGFLKEAILVCANNDSGIERWEAFRTDPAISAGLAHADEVRAPYYQRLYEGESWQRRWQSTEFTVNGYAGDMMEEQPPGPAGCARLWQELATFETGGWIAYSAAVDRFFAAMKPQVQICAE